MKHKTHHQHLAEEKEDALSTLKKAKDIEKDKVAIYLQDNFHTILLVNRSKAKKKIEELKKQGKIIKRVL